MDGLRASRVESGLCSKRNEPVTAGRNVNGPVLTGRNVEGLRASWVASGLGKQTEWAAFGLGSSIMMGVDRSGICQRCVYI